MALDIFELLKNINSGNKNYYSNLSPAEQKEIYFFLIQRWMSGTTDAKQIVYLNNFANNKVWSLHKEGNLLYLLLTACSTGKKHYQFPKKKKKDSRTETLKVVMNYYKCGMKDAIDYLKILSLDDIMDICDACAIDKEIVTKIKKEIK